MFLTTNALNIRKMANSFIQESVVDDNCVFYKTCETEVDGIFLLLAGGECAAVVDI